MPKVDSSMIYRVEYDRSAKELDITFTSGKTYTYYDVPRSIYDGLLKAGSKGRFFLDNIEGEYEHATVRQRRRA